MIISRRVLLRTISGSALASLALGLAYAADVRIHGAGSSFVNAAMQSWIKAVPPALGVNVAYEASHSGPGRAAVMGGEVDFACSDEAMTADKLKMADLAQFPVAYGCIAIVVNVPGVLTNQLVLSGELLGGIFAGSIKKWNDPKIAALNPGLTLPDLAITPISQGTPTDSSSGTTFTFTRYMLSANADWRAKFGPAIKTAWAAGTQVLDGDSAVYSVQTVPGAVAYVALPSALSNKLAIVKLKNKAGKVVEPGASSIAAALKSVDWAKTPDLVADLIDLPGEGAWPILAVTYALVPRNPAKKPKGEAVKAFFKFLLTEGSGEAAKSNAAGLPAAARDAALAILDQTAI